MDLTHVMEFDLHPATMNSPIETVWNTFDFKFLSIPKRGVMCPGGPLDVLDAKCPVRAMNDDFTGEALRRVHAVEDDGIAGVPIIFRFPLKRVGQRRKVGFRG